MGRYQKQLIETKPSLDGRLAKLQSFMPKGLVDKTLSTKGQIEGERKIVTVLLADMQEELTKLNEELQKRAGSSIRIRVGINTVAIVSKPH
jgi:hypothetical protein